MYPTIELQMPIGEATEALAQALERGHYRVVRSFDLREATGAHSACTCPHHGTAACTCQYLMLIAYPGQGADSQPLSLSVHGRDQQTLVSLVSGPENAWLGIVLPLITGQHYRKEATMSEKSFSVPNISCGHCTHTIQMELRDLPGVQRVQADIATRQVTVAWIEPATWEQIKATLAEINYPAAE